MASRNQMIRLCLTASLLALAACSDDSTRPRHEAGATDGSTGGDRPAAVKLSFSISTVDTAEAGKNASLAVSGSKVGVAYFRVLKDPVTVTCPDTALTPGGPKPRPAQDLMFVENAGTSWGTPAKVDQTIGDTQGLSLAYDKSGKAFIGYLGGALNQNECSSGDAVISSSADGKTFTQRTVLAAGPVGDTVGYWMAVAIDSKGGDHAAFGDVRFSYYEVEGKQKASARYDETDVIASQNGAGVWNGLVFDPSDNPVVIYFNPQQKGIDGGIQLAIKQGGNWLPAQLVAGDTEEKPSLALSPLGNLGVSYYDPSKQQVAYIESDKTDHLKVPWKAETVDTNATIHAGEFSSLAYDSRGNPGIAYYKCGVYGEGSCDFAKDGLRFAWRSDGVNWTVYDVDAGDAYECGTYTSVAFVADLPVIAYRCVTYDSTTKDSLGALKVARGVVK